MIHKKQTIYLDNAATTPVHPKVLKAMLPYFVKNFGNASAIHTVGQIANGALNDARRIIAEILHALSDNIIFTSGGTESNNLAIFGVAKVVTTPHPDLSRGERGNSPFPPRGNVGMRGVGHIITTPIEHHAVLHPVEELKKQGWEVTYVPVDKNGLVNPEDVIKAIRPDTRLISIMYANNEIGTIEPIAEIGRAILKYRKEHTTPFPYFHTDACQAAEYLDLDVEKLHIDLMTLNGSKMYGPKGVGLLYIRRGVKIEPLIVGGNQEWRKRAGTENIPGIVGLAAALQLAQQGKVKESKRLRALATCFLNGLQKKISGVELRGPAIGPDRLPNNINISIKGIEGEAMLIYLNESGIMCSTGSACTTQSSDPSHVLTAIGLTRKEAYESLRFSLGRSTNRQQIDFVVNSLKRLLTLLKHN
ncbi:MAG: cysteine desulfurase [Candidatus Magasanikbacteria bacterium]|nr:cysteine desulfurase [Candidatus Magasanikbacteria bacterium]